MTQPARVTAFSFCLCYRRPNHLNALRFTLGIFSGKIFFYCKQASPAELACLLFHRKSCFLCRERSRGTGFIAFIKIIAAGDAPLGQRQGGVFRVPPPSTSGLHPPRNEKGAARPFQTPKLLGSIQKIQVASLKDFLCCADLKSLARQNVRATACFHADVNAPAGSQHQQMPFAVTTLPVKKQLRNGRSRFGVANKNTISAIYAQSEAESIPNRLSRFNAPSQNPPAKLRRSGGAPVSAPASRRIPDGTVPETAPEPAAVRCRSPSGSRTSQW